MGSAGIETRAGGQLFRSRLEAKWATFFDLIGWRWTYEPFDGDYYSPDFLIHGDKPFLIEVKPYSHVDQCETEWKRISPRVADHNILVVGADPVLGRSKCFGGQIAGYWSDDWNQPDVAIWSHCMHHNCPFSDLRLSSDRQSFMNRPCGHHDGDHWMYPCTSLETISPFWREASNETRWMPKT